MTTLDLLEKARRKRGMSLADYSRHLKMNRTALNVAIYRGKLSPRLARSIARDIGEDEQRWMAMAAAENLH